MILVNSTRVTPAPSMDTLILNVNLKLVYGTFSSPHQVMQHQTLLSRLSSEADLEGA